MAKSKALLEAATRIAELEEMNMDLQYRVENGAEQQKHIQELYDRLARREKKVEDLKNRSRLMAKGFMDTSLTLAGVIVEAAKINADGPFRCLGLMDFDPERIFQFFAEKIPGGDHWQPQPEPAGEEKEENIENSG
jgi:hypothetical protein